MQIEKRSPLMIFAVFSFVGLLAFSGTAYAQKQIIQKVAT